MSVSITEIAKRLNVSHSTVSRVLNNRGRRFASEETTRHILELAAELNYRPNRLASGLLRGKTNMIGVVTGRCNSCYIGNVVEGVRQGCDNHNYQVLLGRANNNEDEESKQVRLLLDYKVDGLICVADGWDNEHILQWLDEVLARSLPCVIVDSRAFASKVDSVVTDDVAGAATATRYLIELGHRRICHVSAGEFRTTAVDRRNGYVIALAEAGIPLDPDLIRGWAYDIQSAIDATRRLLGASPRPTAIFAANDDAAYWVWRTVEELGLKVPDDVSIVGYGNLDVSLGLGLTTMDQSPMRIGATVVEVLMRRMAETDEPPSLLELETTLVRRRSTAPITS